MLNVVQRPVAPTNFRSGRKGHSIIGIVIHISTGSAAGTDAWFNNPESHVSAHYLVCRDGEIHQYVQEADTAFHAGVVQAPTWWFAQQHPEIVNQSTVGIEHEGKAEEDITEEQYAASAELVHGVATRAMLPIDNLHIVPHHSIRADKTCPGKLDVSKLIGLARGIA